jgi:hypothetical protein
MIFDTDEFSEDFFKRERIAKSSLAVAFGQYLKIENLDLCNQDKKDEESIWIISFIIVNPDGKQVDIFGIYRSEDEYPFLSIGEKVDLHSLKEFPPELGSFGVNYQIVLPADPSSREKYLPYVNYSYVRKTGDISLN